VDIEGRREAFDHLRLLATLGYGDILPSSPFTQMLAVLEAVIGQFFMTVLVAWLVGLFISHNVVGSR
jgi:voltage-gated potassium channel